MTFSTKWLFYQALVVVLSAAMPRVLGVNAWIESLIGGIIWFGFNYAHYRWVLFEEDRHEIETPIQKQTPDSSTKNKGGVGRISYDRFDGD